jgi:hypothetical protein
MVRINMKFFLIENPSKAESVKRRKHATNHTASCGGNGLTMWPSSLEFTQMKLKKGPSEGR